MADFVRRIPEGDNRERDVCSDCGHVAYVNPKVVVGSGWKENHNAVIIRIPEFEGGLPNDSETAYTKFVNDNNAVWLGMWDGIGDYWMAGVLEFKPKDDFQGSGIFIGIGGIEWHQNTGNAYQANIELMYKNAIDYLKTK